MRKAQIPPRWIAGLTFLAAIHSCPSAFAVYNGAEVPARIYGSVVQIHTDPIACSGVAIGPTVVLTAAHCFNEVSNEAIHRMQGKTLTISESHSLKAARFGYQVIPHPGFQKLPDGSTITEDRVWADLAIVQLDHSILDRLPESSVSCLGTVQSVLDHSSLVAIEAFEANGVDRLSPVPNPEPGRFFASPVLREIFQVVGYGMTSRYSATYVGSRDRIKVNMKSMVDVWINKPNKFRSIRSKSRSENAGPAKGDSGGGLFYGGVLMGIQSAVSWVKEAERPFRPNTQWTHPETITVFADLAPSLEWIESVSGISPENCQQQAY